jgi:hypothetical protein
MRLDTSGNLGLGVTPNAWLSSTVAMQLGNYGSVFAFKNSGNVYLNNNLFTNSVGNEIYLNTAPAGRYRISDNTHLWYNAPSGTAGTSATLTQAMTLDASGNLIMASRTGGTVGQIQAGRTANTASTNAYVTFAAASGEPYPLGIRGESTNQGLIGFFDSANGLIGSISKSGSNTAYNTSSDYRLKENIAPMTGALMVVAQLKPCTYTWKADGTEGQGFIAHELQAVLPDAVNGEKDAVNEDGSIKPQGIDTSFLVATLTAAIQEQQAMIASQSFIIQQLQADVATLKGQA